MSILTRLEVNASSLVVSCHKLSNFECPVFFHLPIFIAFCLFILTSLICCLGCSSKRITYSFCAGAKYSLHLYKPNCIVLARGHLSMLNFHLAGKAGTLHSWTCDN